MKKRTKALVVAAAATFGGGLLAGLVVGAWGLLLFAIFFVANVLTVVVRRRRAHPDQAFPVATVVGALTGAVSLGVALFFLYLVSYQWTEHYCSQAAMAPTVAERTAAVEDMKDYAWLKWLVERLTGKGVFVADCDGLARSLKDLEHEGSCPTFPPDDVLCRCGRLRSEQVACGPQELLVCKSRDQKPLRCEPRSRFEQ